MQSSQAPKLDPTIPSPELWINGQLFLLYCYITTRPLPTIRYTKSSTDKLWVTSHFREVVKCRQKAFLEGNLVKYHRLRNRTQHMAAKLRKSYFTSRVEQLHSCNPRQWWSKTRHILKTDDPNPLANLDHQGPPEQLAECINNFLLMSPHICPRSTLTSWLTSTMTTIKTLLSTLPKSKTVLSI